MSTRLGQTLTNNCVTASKSDKILPQTNQRGDDPDLELRGPGRAGQPGPHHHHQRQLRVRRPRSVSYQHEVSDGKILSALSSSLSFTPFLSPYFLFLCPFSHISSILDSIHLWMFVISLKLSTLLTVRLLKNNTLVSMNSTNRHLCIKNRRYALLLFQSHYDIRVCFFVWLNVYI